MEALAKSDDARDSERVLILAPYGRDAEVAARILLDAGVDAFVCGSAEELCAQIRAGAGAMVAAIESLREAAVRLVATCLDEQPSWSEVPLIIFAATGAGGATPPLEPLDQRAHITVLDRPVAKKTLVSAVRSALRSRQRQYELRDVLEALERRIQERDRFLAILGHELRNPLGAILLASQMADEDDRKGLDRQHAEIIERQARHLSHLVNDLLDLSRITAGKIVLQRSTIDLAAAVEQCLKTIRDSSALQDHHLELRSELQAAPVFADPVRLEQIISNLLSNAIKYTPSGGWIEVKVFRRGKLAALSVRDSGVGIASERLGSIFGLFAQAENAIGRAQGGMGIGLSLVKNLVELHGGQVNAISPGVGRGSEFDVTLPIATGSWIASGRRADAADRAVNARSVLIIEDNDDVRTLLELRLRKAGHHVTSAPDGERGLLHVAEARPDIAIVDLGLPGIDGHEVARRIRQLCRDDIYLVALSGFGQPEDKRRAAEAGFDEHLTKPVDGNDLEALFVRADSVTERDAE